MRLRVLTGAVMVFGVLAGTGCLPKLKRMAETEATHDLECTADELKTSVTLTTPPYSRYTVKGCGRYVTYKGTCDSARAGCDAATRHPRCDGSCRLVDREDYGDLENGSK